MAAGQPASSDPVSNPVLSPEASLFTRELLENALANPPAAAAGWRAKAQALLANVLMNDVLNGWNNAGQAEINNAQTQVNNAIAANPPNPVMALAQHAQGLIHRGARPNPNHAGAQAAFQNALNLDPGFARAQVQLANELVLSGGNTNQARAQIQTAINQNPLHPAVGYFYWAMGRAYFVDQNWPDAIKWLSKSVNALPTVTYNRAYLAAAKQHAGNVRGAQITKRQFINNPQFGNPQLGNQKMQAIIPVAAANPNNNRLVAARQNLRVGLLAIP
jgi:tetratricopeptide (TPR) repeat protein